MTKQGGKCVLTLFQVCFFVGAALIALSLVFGSVFEAFGIDGLELDFDFIGLDIFLPVSPILYILFSIVFGGVGWILLKDNRNIPQIIVLIISMLAGILVCVLLNILVIKPLKNLQNTSTPASEELVGLNATVSEKIFEDGFGEISYVIHGNTYSSPARGIEGEEIKYGVEVAICWIEDYVFYVSPLKSKFNEEKSE